MSIRRQLPYSEKVANALASRLWNFERIILIDRDMANPKLKEICGLGEIEMKWLKSIPYFDRGLAGDFPATKSNGIEASYQCCVEIKGIYKKVFGAPGETPKHHRRRNRNEKPILEQGLLYETRKLTAVKLFEKIDFNQRVADGQVNSMVGNDPFERRMSKRRLEQVVPILSLIADGLST